jgi:hypothetical protein
MGALILLAPQSCAAVQSSSLDNIPAGGQEQSAQAQSPPRAANVARTTVRGVVKNAATGEPLPRALVRIEGDAAAGMLTDGDGRFEMQGVPIGPQAFQVVKPGFGDQAAAGMMAGPVVNGATNSEHNVHVAADMPELVFNMSPTNSIRGQIELSTGDPAQNIGVMLLRRSVQDGRAVWQAATNVRTNSEGVYRFSGLADGTYMIYTEPSMDSELPVGLVEADNQAVVMRAGFPSMFYPEARDMAGAGKIQLAGGQQAQANILLAQEPFYMVRAKVTLPGAGPTKAGDRSQTNVTIVVQDAQGHQLSYGGQYDQASRSVQAFLPDGTYSLLLTVVTPHMPARFGTGRALPAMAKSEGPLVGQVDFSVNGHSVTNLTIPLTAQQNNMVQLAMVRTATPSGVESQGGPLVVMLSQTGGWITDGMVSSYAEGYATGPLEATFMGPGTYWVHTSIPQRGLCESSFTAGGASLAREPLAISLSGATAPLTLTLRDDCAKLKVSLPPSVEEPTVGEEPYYTVYVVPEFDSTSDITPITLRASSGGELTIDGLTPGAYRVFCFTTPVEFEYRNPEALAASSTPGQVITLTPGMTGNLIVEVPGH